MGQGNNLNYTWRTLISYCHSEKITCYCTWFSENLILMLGCSHKAASRMVSFIWKGTENIAMTLQVSVGCPTCLRVFVYSCKEKGGEGAHGKELLPCQGRVPVKLVLFCLKKCSTNKECDRVYQTWVGGGKQKGKKKSLCLVTQGVASIRPNNQNYSWKKKMNIFCLFVLIV